MVLARTWLMKILTSDVRSYVRPSFRLIIGSTGAEGTTISCGQVQGVKQIECSRLIISDMEFSKTPSLTVQAPVLHKLRFVIRRGCSLPPGLCHIVSQWVDKISSVHRILRFFMQ